MVNHHGGWQRREEVIQLGQVLRFKINHHMPAQRAMRLAISNSTSRGVKSARALDEIETGAAHAGGMHVLQFGIGHIAVHGGYPARLVIRCFQASTNARLSEPWHVACTMTFFGKAQVVAQGKQLLLRRIAGCVLAFWRIRELCAGAEHVAVGIYAPAEA